MLSSLWLFSSTCPGARSDMDGSERERASSERKKKRLPCHPAVWEVRSYVTCQPVLLLCRLYSTPTLSV